MFLYGRKVESGWTNVCGEHSPTACATFRCLKPTVTSLSVALPSFLALLKVRFCQYRGSLSTSEMMFHTVPMDVEISWHLSHTSPIHRLRAALPPHSPAKPVPPCMLVSAPAPVLGFIKVTQWPAASPTDNTFFRFVMLS